MDRTSLILVAPTNSGITIERWYARITAPLVSELFACISQRLDGQ
jgi:hypothetical protein